MSIALWCGCRGGELEIAPAAGGQGSTEEPSVITPPTDPELRPKFIPARDARPAPVLEVTNLGGEQREVQPGDEDSVTLVVFWSMGLQADHMAARHVSDLARKYRALGVRAVGFVEKTYYKGKPLYPAAPRFMRAQGITHPVYYDDFSALDQMGDAAGVSVGKVVPCFFLVDRKQRVRMFKRGFNFYAATAWTDESKRLEELVYETAADGEHIEDYLKRLLAE
jgi:hypothetical protein